MNSELEEQHEFRAIYYAILHEQALIALEMACSQFPSVAYGHESLEDKIKYYLEEAKESPQLEKFLDTVTDQEPPRRLREWLGEKINAKINEVSSASPQGADPQS